MYVCRGSSRSRPITSTRMPDSHTAKLAPRMAKRYIKPASPVMKVQGKQINAAKGRNKIRNVIASRVRSTLFFRLAHEPCNAPGPLLRGYRFEAGNLDLLLLPGPEFELQLARALPPCHLQPDYISRMQRSQ